MEQVTSSPGKSATKQRSARSEESRRQAKLEKSREAARNRRRHKRMETDGLEQEMQELYFMSAYLKSCRAAREQSDYGVMGPFVSKDAAVEPATTQSAATIARFAPSARQKTAKRGIRLSLPEPHLVTPAVASGAASNPETREHLASVVGSRREAASLTAERKAAAFKSAAAGVVDVVAGLLTDMRPVASACLVARFSPTSPTSTSTPTPSTPPSLGTETQKILAVCAQRRRPGRSHGHHHHHPSAAGSGSSLSSGSSKDSGAGSSGGNSMRDFDVMRLINAASRTLALSPDQVVRLRPLVAEARTVASALLAMERVVDVLTAAPWVATPRTDGMLETLLDHVDSDQYDRFVSWITRNDVQINALSLSQRKFAEMPVGASPTTSPALGPMKRFQ